jgi:hypothetical protein
MGLKGSVRRALDGHYIHANCDTDVIVSEEPPNGGTEKPVELYEIIERFCMGKRWARVCLLFLLPPAHFGNLPAHSPQWTRCILHQPHASPRWDQDCCWQ